MDKPKYRYQKLEVFDAIRLLRLEPSSDLSAQIQCSLFTSTLRDYDADTIDHYTAISYVWGDSSKRVTISVDEQALDITISLDAALRHIRDTVRPRNLWADAICINQSDDKEKGQQVRQMGDVYRIAQHTIIYLGEATSLSDSLFQEITTKSTALYHIDIEEDEVKELFNRPWFTRVWTFQELLFSRDPWLQCGKLRVRWEALSQALKVFASIDFLNSRTFNQMNSSRQELAMKKLSRSRDMGDFMDILLTTLQKRRGLGVQDPRDMIFAHLGIAFDVMDKIFIDDEGDYQPLGDSYFNVDYTKSTKEVFTNVATYALKLKENYDILFYAESNVDVDSRPYDLPSWVPDWKSPGLPPTQTSIREAMLRKPPDNVKGTLHFKSRKSDNVYYILANNIQNLRNPANFPDARLLTWADDNTRMEILPYILRCKGFKLGVIKELSAEITSKHTSFHVSPKELESINTRIIVSLLKVLLRHWLPILSPITIPLTPRSTSLPSTPEVLKGDSQLQELKMRDSQFLIDHLCMLALTKMLKSPYRPFLVGRRVAQLQSGNLAVVPSQAKVGDVACLVAGSTIPYIFRPYCLSSIDTYKYSPSPSSSHPSQPTQIPTSSLLSVVSNPTNTPFLTSAIWGNEPPKLDELETELLRTATHYKYVGEAFVEHVMFEEGVRKCYDGVFGEVGGLAIH